MTKVRITVPLQLEEKAALCQLAEQERRQPRDQAAWLIRQSLERLGLLQSDEMGRCEYCERPNAGMAQNEPEVRVKEIEGGGVALKPRVVVPKERTIGYD